MKPILSFITAYLLLASWGLADDLPRTAIPTQRLSPEWRAERHEEKKALAAQGNIDWVMLGDSITHGFERPGLIKWFDGYRVLNLGVGGDTTQNVLWRIQNGEIDGIAPKLVTVMIGTNNSGRDPAADIYVGIQTIVAELRTRLPDAKVVVFSVFPRKPGKGQDTLEELNAMLPQLADGKQVLHLDINDRFLDEAGSQIPQLYGKDLLHLKGPGYKVWFAALETLAAEYGVTRSTE